MRDSDKFLEAIDDMIEILMGKRPNRALEKEMRMIERNGDRRSKDRGTQDRRVNYTKRAIEREMKMMKRARDEMGRYIGDDPTTLDVNEAWVSGHTPVKSPFPTPEPSMKWTRKQLIGYCNEFGVLHSSDDSKLQLLNKIKETYPNGL
mgnify:FL=1|tara:strand:+ start:1113 stop:1556 length:444 start_codon:yes stop_codon:yes gene_type:complete